MRLKNSYQNINITFTQTTSPSSIAVHAGNKKVRSADAEDLNPVFQKSATELKHKRKFLKCKSTIQI